MIKRIYNKYDHMIKTIVNRKIEYNKYRIKCWDYLITARAHGIKKALLNKYKKDAELIIPTEKDKLPHIGELKKEVMRVMAARAQSMSDSWEESEKSGTQMDNLLSSWAGQLSMMVAQRQKFDSFCFDWESMVQRKGQLDITQKAMKDVVDNIEGKIRLSKGDRETIKKLGIDFRYRILGKNWSTLRVCLYFTIHDIIMDVKTKGDTREGFSVHYPSPVVLMAIISFDSLAAAVRVFVRDYSYDLDKATKDGKEKTLTFEQLFSITNPVYYSARAKAINSKGCQVKFPFVEGWGTYRGSPCFGQLDRDIRGATKKLSLVSMASLLRQWVSNFVWGETNPYSNVTHMYPGIPPEYGELGIEMGQDTTFCRRIWIDTSADCDKIKCILREGEFKTTQCPQYQKLKDEEEKAEAMKLAIEKAKEKSEAPDGMLTGDQAREISEEFTRFVVTNRGSNASPEERRRARIAYRRAVGDREDPVVGGGPYRREGYVRNMNNPVTEAMDIESNLDIPNLSNRGGQSE